jgi:hypothetical protein
MRIQQLVSYDVTHVIEGMPLGYPREAKASHGNNLFVISEAQLRDMSHGERRELARMLASLDYPHPLLELNWHRGRKLGVLISMAACIVLLGWIIVLMLTLNRHYTATHWRFAWVGFDIVLLSAFAMTGWAFWRGRQIVIACMLVTGTLLCCDAWFDVILDLGTSGIWESLASAVVIELPLAFLMFRGARRLILLSALLAVSAREDLDTVPSLWRVPLLGGAADLGRSALQRPARSRSADQGSSGAPGGGGLA